MNPILPLLIFTLFLSLIRYTSSLCSTTSSCQIHFGLEASCIESVCVCQTGLISKVSTTCEADDVLPEKAKETDPWIRIEYFILLGAIVVLAFFSVYTYRKWKRKNGQPNEENSNNNNNNNNKNKPATNPEPSTSSSPA